MTNQTPQTLIDALQQQIDNAPTGFNVAALEKAIEALKAANPGAPVGDDQVKIWFLLDRSGSMAHVAEDVIGGFNQFLTEQGNKPGKAQMTAIQFDGDDPFEVIFDAQEVAQVPELTSDLYRPRGVTPLYDAIGQVIARADARIVDRASQNQSIEDQLVIVFTDGLENASRNFTRSQIFELIHDRTDQDWTFVFMGANQDSYGEGHKIGLVDGNVQNYDSSGESVHHAFYSISRASSEFRAKPRRQRHTDKGDFFGGLKEAENASRRERGS